MLSRESMKSFFPNHRVYNVTIHPLTLRSTWPTAHVLNRSYGLGTVLGAGDTMVNKTNDATLSAASSLISMRQGE